MRPQPMNRERLLRALLQAPRRAWVYVHEVAIHWRSARLASSQSPIANPPRPSRVRQLMAAIDGRKHFVPFASNSGATSGESLDRRDSVSLSRTAKGRRYEGREQQSAQGRRWVPPWLGTPEEAPRSGDQSLSTAVWTTFR